MTRMRPGIFRSHLTKHDSHAYEDSCTSRSKSIDRIVSWEDSSTTSDVSTSSHGSNAKSLKTVATSIFNHVKNSARSSRRPSYPGFLPVGDVEVAEEDQEVFYLCCCTKCKISPRHVSYMYKPRLLRAEPAKQLQKFLIRDTLLYDKKTYSSIIYYLYQ